MNQKIRRANSFYGFRRHSAKISRICTNVVVRIIRVASRDNHERNRQDTAQTCRRRDDDISRRHNIGMTCAEFVARHEFASNKRGDIDTEEARLHRWASFLSIFGTMMLLQDVIAYASISHVLVSVSKSARTPRRSAFRTGVTVALLQSRAEVLEDQTLRTSWLAGIARGTEGPDELQTNCEIADDRPIRDRPCNRSRASSHFFLLVLRYVNCVPRVYKCRRIFLFFFFLFFALRVIAIKIIASIHEVNTWNIDTLYLRLRSYVIKTAMTHVGSFYETFLWNVVLCEESNRWDNVTECQSDLRVPVRYSFSIFNMRQPWNYKA